jgi:hypothetical protein
VIFGPAWISKGPSLSHDFFWIERNHVQGKMCVTTGLSVGVGHLDRDARRRILGKVLHPDVVKAQSVLEGVQIQRHLHDMLQSGTRRYK